MNRSSGLGKDPGGNPPVEERAEQVARSLGARLIVGAVEATVVSVPLTVLTALVISHSGPLHRLDQGIADSLHGYVAPRPVLSSTLGLISVITHPNSVRLASAALAGALWWQGHRRRAAWLAVTIAVGGGLDPLLKDAIARARPAFDQPITTAPGYSFPSGHALNSMLFAVCVVMLGYGVTRGRPVLRTLLWAFAVLLVLVTGFDRIALGVHYTSDVVAGWLVALLTVAVTTAAFESWRRDVGLRPSDTSVGLDPERGSDE